MAIRRQVNVSRSKAQEDELEDLEQEVEDQEVEEEDDLDVTDDDEDEEDDLDVTDDDEEEEDEPAPAKRSKVSPPAAKPATKQPAKPAAAVKPAVKQPATKQPAKPAAAVKPATKAKPATHEEDEPAAPTVKVKSVATLQADNIVLSVLQALEAGKSIVITRKEDGDWILRSGEAVRASGKGTRMSSAEYSATVFTPEYLQWREEWRDLPYDEKLALAKKAKCKWDEHTNQNINLMRLMEAYRTKKGIEMYKPEYQDGAVRRALRAGKPA